MLRTLAVTIAFAAAPAPAIPTAVHHTHTGSCSSLRCMRSWGRRHHWHPPTPAHVSRTSWYDDSGPTACGSHATLGFAHIGPGEGPFPGMACGTRVRFCYRGRCATGTMDDHGPYIFTREFDLDEALRAAIGAETDQPVRWKVVG